MTVLTTDVFTLRDASAARDVEGPRSFRPAPVRRADVLFAAVLVSLGFWAAIVAVLLRVF